MDFHRSAATFPHTGHRLGHRGLSNFQPPGRFHCAETELQVLIVAQHAAGLNGAGIFALPQKVMRGHFEKRCPSLDQGPRKAERLALAKNAPKPVKKIIAIGVVPENRTPLDPSHDDRVQETRCI
jgi:hypothetical protein